MHPDLALLPGSHLLAGLRVRQTQCQAGQRGAAGAHDAWPGGRLCGDGASGLAAAVAVQEADAEGVFEGFVQRGRAGRTGRHAHPQLGQFEPALAREVHHAVVGGGGADEEGGLLAADGLHDLVRCRALHDVGTGADGQRGEDADVVRGGVVQRHGPHEAVGRGQTEDRPGARGRGPQGLALGRDHALGASGGAGRVQDPGRLVQVQVVPRVGGRRGDGEVLEVCGTRHGLGGTDDDQAAVQAAAPNGPYHLGYLCRAADHRAGAAVGQVVGELGVGGPRVDRHADGSRARDGEITLDHLDPVAHAQQDAVAAADPECGEVPGQEPGAPLQSAVGDGTPRVLESPLVRSLRGVVREDLVQRADKCDRGLFSHSSTSNHMDNGRTLTIRAAILQAPPTWSGRDLSPTFGKQYVEGCARSFSKPGRVMSSTPPVRFSHWPGTQGERFIRRRGPPRRSHVCHPDHGLTVRP